MDSSLNQYYRSHSNKVTHQLTTHRLALIIGIYGSGKSLLIDKLTPHLPNSIHINLKDIHPEKSAQVYQLAHNELIQQKLINSSMPIPQTEFDFHYLLHTVMN